MTITEFLLARIAEDEAVVHAATAPGQMHPYGDTDLPEVSMAAFPDEVRRYLGGSWGEHCARWSFERVLAECEAKRRIVDDCILFDDESTSGGALGRRVLEALALPYADHPDYRQEWRP